MHYSSLGILSFFCLTLKAQLEFERAGILSLINNWWDLFAIVYTNLVKWSCAKSFYVFYTSFLCGHALPPTHPPKATTFAFSLQKCKSSIYGDLCFGICICLSLDEFVNPAEHKWIGRVKLILMKFNSNWALLPPPTSATGQNFHLACQNTRIKTPDIYRI